MAEGKGRARWAQTAMLCTLIANANRDPKRGRAFKPDDFDPYAKLDRRRRQPAGKQDLAMLRAVLDAQKGNRHGPLSAQPPNQP